MRPLSDRMSVVILTHNRAYELLRTLEHMHALPEQPVLVVVDNASIDNTVALVAKNYPTSGWCACMPTWARQRAMSASSM